MIKEEREWDSKTGKETSHNGRLIKDQIKLDPLQQKKLEQYDYGELHTE